jgi:hypothetical protein
MAALVALALVACAGGSGSARRSDEARAVRDYIAAIEPLRLGVNALLDGADPILTAYHDHRSTPAAAAAQMSDLEHRFAQFSVSVNAIAPTNPALAKLHATYASTYALEDSYLSALVLGLSNGDLSDLPDTENDQRVAIIEWRTELQVEANRTSVTLPADIQQAGRGEIAPSPDGS